MTGHPELNAMARSVIDANHYMVLGTRDPDGGPRLSRVYYTPARYSDFYWVSSPESHHSRNLLERPAVEIGLKRRRVRHRREDEVQGAGAELGLPLSRQRAEPQLRPPPRERPSGLLRPVGRRPRPPAERIAPLFLRRGRERLPPAAPDGRSHRAPRHTPTPDRSTRPARAHGGGRGAVPGRAVRRCRRRVRAPDARWPRRMDLVHGFGRIR
jgi:hypothetical protein